MPAAELAASIVALSHRLAAEFSSTLVLDPERGPFPHLTLYLTGYEERSVPMIAPVVTNSLAELAAPHLAVTGLTASDQGSILLIVEKTPALDHLHRSMLEKLNPLRGRARPRIWEERRARYGPKELQQLETFGFPQALELWLPHFTIGKVAQRQAHTVKSAFGPVRFAGMAQYTGIGTVGEHGSLPQVLGSTAFRT